MASLAESSGAPAPFAPGVDAPSSGRVASALTLALAQINPTVGDIAGNRARIAAARAEAAQRGADLMITPELVITGYPPEDLILREAFLDEAQAAVEALARDTADGGPAVILGAPWRVAGGRFNAALLLEGGQITGRVFKHHLPNYGVFDEKRVFDPGPMGHPLAFRGLSLGVMICEDMWFSDVAAHLAHQGAELLVVPNGSPFDVNKSDDRLREARGRVRETGLPLVYVNQVGGQDELVFDGASFVLEPERDLVAALPRWQEAVATVEMTAPARAVTGGGAGDGPDPRGPTLPVSATAPPVGRGAGGWRAIAPPIALPPLERAAEIYGAMMVGLRDYVGKNGFPGVLLGLSGGIDSALSAAVAVDALGPERVWCVMMPSPYTSRESLDDAAACARLLGVRLDEVGIGPAMAAFATMLAPLTGEAPPDIMEENIQSRARGMTLMALSNRFGPMVLSTGNKSEMSVGYATLYGDMCGGYSVLKDVYKTTVVAVSRWRNGTRPPGGLGPAGPVMPERVITKPPTAELRPNQKDEDSLPPYDQLDRILHLLIEERCSITQTVADSGLPADLVARVWRLLCRAEYKRRQAPPGVKVTQLAFGRDRRYPITQRYTG